MKIYNKIPHVSWYMWTSIPTTQIRPYKKDEKKKFCPKEVEPTDHADKHMQRQTRLLAKA